MAGDSEADPESKSLIRINIVRWSVDILGIKQKCAVCVGKRVYWIHEFTIRPGGNANGEEAKQLSPRGKKAKLTSPSSYLQGHHLMVVIQYPIA